nr:hypothetical protein CFP56_09371 [Quercus suber]
MRTASGHDTSRPGTCSSASKRKKSILIASAAVDQTSCINLASRLAALPGEIVSNIGGRLGSDDFFSFRLTCRDVEAKSLHTFAMEYFSCKGFIFTSDSLKVLLHIAESERLHKYLRCVQFVTAYFPERQIECSNGCRCYAAPTIRQKEAYKDYMADQTQLKATGADKKLLAKSFRLLPQLDTIDIVDHFVMIDKSVDIRGLNKVQRVTGLPLTVPNESNVDKQYRTWLSHVWKAVVVAIAQRPMPNLEELRMLGRTALNGLSVSDLGLSDKTVAGVHPTFGGLKRLNLCLRSRSKSTASSQQNMVNFGGLFSNLEELRLSFDYFQSAEIPNVDLLQNTDLSKLSKLHIDGLHTSSESLCALLARTINATEVFFMWINIKDGTWVTVLAALQKLPHLEHLHLQWLGQGAHKAYFLKQMTNPTRDSDDEWNDFVRPPVHATVPARRPAPVADDANNASSSDEVSDQISEWSDDLPSDSSVVDNEQGLVEGERIITDNDNRVDDVNHSEPDLDVDDYPEDDVLDTPVAGRAHNGVNGAAYETPTEENFRAPGNEGYNERGYYVCIHQDDIAKYLPIFIDEYNVGQDLADTNTDTADLVAAAMGPPPQAPRAAMQAGGHPHAAAFGDVMFNSLADLLGGRGGPLPRFPLGPGDGGRPGRT